MIYEMNGSTRIQSTSKYLARAQISELEQLLHQLHQRGVLEQERLAAVQAVRGVIWERRRDALLG